MSTPMHSNHNISPEKLEALMRAARIERARVVRAALASAFHWLRGLASARPRHRAVPGAVRC